MRTYYTKKDKSEIAFCMPCNQDFVCNYKIVRQNQKKRSSILRLMDKKFRTQEEAQVKLDKIAKAKGWKLAFES